MGATLNLEDEVRELAMTGGVDAAAATLAMRMESRAVFSVRGELLVVLYAAVAMITGGVGWLVRVHHERIGPAGLTIALFVAAALCLALPVRTRLAGRERGLALDYVLLLGALLASSAVGFAESRFHWLGDGWALHLLLLAAVHALIAYALDSRLVLSVALTSFAAWLGLDPRFGLLDGATPWLGLGPRAIGCAAVFAVGALAHARGARLVAFRDVYEAFAANFALAGALALGFGDGTLWLGAALLVAFAVAIGRYGLARRRESLVLFAVGYGTVGVIGLEAKVVGSVLLASNLGLLTVAGSVLLMLKLHARLRQADG